MSQTSIREKLSRYQQESIALFRSIPAIAVSLLVVSVVCMNLLANKTIVSTEWLALDGGILMSWMCFLSMDVIAKHFGPRAANKVSLLAVLINLLVCLIFKLVSLIPSEAADYSEFNTIFGGTWFILLASTIAFIVSAWVNNGLNWSIGQAFKRNPDGKLAFVTRSYVSTLIGQFIDNLLFAVIVFRFFAPIYWDGFSWTWLQCVMCALTGALVELAMEILFSPIGYAVTKRWRAEGVGQEYLALVAKR